MWRETCNIFSFQESRHDVGIHRKNRSPVVLILELSNLFSLRSLLQTYLFYEFCIRMLVQMEENVETEEKYYLFLSSYSSNLKSLFKVK